MMRGLCMMRGTGACRLVRSAVYLRARIANFPQPFYTTIMYLTGTSHINRIGFVSTRFQGTDGVSLEMVKWENGDCHLCEQTARGARRW